MMSRGVTNQSIYGSLSFQVPAVTLFAAFLLLCALTFYGGPKSMEFMDYQFFYILCTSITMRFIFTLFFENSYMRPLVFPI